MTCEIKVFCKGKVCMSYITCGVCSSMIIIDVFQPFHGVPMFHYILFPLKIILKVAYGLPYVNQTASGSDLSS